jgi:hypothetical protein
VPSERPFLVKKFLSSVVAAAAALSTVALAAPAANAEVAASVTISASPTIVVPEISCVTHPINYSVAGVIPGKRWTLDVYVYKADGTLRGSGSAMSSMGAPTTGAIDVQFCGMSYEPQTVTVVSELDYYDANDLAVTGVAGNTLALNIVREVKTAVSLKVKRKGSVATAIGKVTASTGTSATPISGGKVTLQKRVGKKWKKVAVKTTSATGAFKIKAKGIKRGTFVRAVFAGLGEYTAVGAGVAIPAKASKVVRVR